MSIRNRRAEDETVRGNKPAPLSRMVAGEIPNVVVDLPPIRASMPDMQPLINDTQDIKRWITLLSSQQIRIMHKLDITIVCTLLAFVGMILVVVLLAIKL